MLLPQGGRGASSDPGSAGLIPDLRELQVLGFVARVSVRTQRVEPIVGVPLGKGDEY